MVEFVTCELTALVKCLSPELPVASSCSRQKLNLLLPKTFV